jgi:transposase
MNIYEKIFTKELLEKEYAKYKSLKGVAKEYYCDAGTIKKYMQKYNIPFDGKIRYDCDHNFFSKNTESSFYWAGFIAADGCLKSRGNSRILQIGLSVKDLNHLEKFKDIINAENPINQYLVKNSNRNPKWKDTIKCELAIYSDQICKDLYRFNIVPAKTHKYTMPNWMINHPLRHHFLRGYFDGDGSFYSHLREDRNTPQYYFNLRGTKKFLNEYRNILKKDVSFENANTDKKIRFSGGIGVLEFGGNGVVRKLVEYLYSESSLYLDRKKKKGFEVYDFETQIDYSDELTKSVLESEYKKYQSIERIAKKHNVSMATIQKHMIKHGIVRQESTQDKRRRFLKELTPDIIKNQLEESGSIRAAAKDLGVGATTLKRYIIKFEV